MKRPILYESNATDFFNLGLGVLTEAKSTLVTEERNGQFTLEMDYPLDGKAFNELKNNRIIKADAGHELKEQRFRIKRITKPMKGYVKVYAEHIRYEANDLPISPEVEIRNATAQTALNIWQQNIVGDYKPFDLTSNITTVNATSWNIREVENAGQALAGVQGSILDTWGGEYKFDNYHISLLRERGRQANAMIAYGRNLTDFEQEVNIMDTYTSIYPYAVWRDDDGNDHLITIPELVIDSEYVDNYPNKKVLPIDFTLEFDQEEQPTSDELRELAERYITQNEVGVPRVSIRLSYLDLSKTLDFKDNPQVEQLNLCDNVRIFFEKLGIQTTAKIVKVIWNVHLERYEELEIGEVRTSLSERLNKIDSQVREVKKEADDARNIAIVSSNGINMTFFGPDEPTATKVGDTWYMEDGTHTILKIWDGVIWRRIIGTDNVEFLEEEMKKNVEKVEEAQQAAEEAKEAGEQARLAGIEAAEAGREAKLAGQEAERVGQEAKEAGELAQQAGEEARRVGEEAREAGSLAQRLAEESQRDAQSALNAANRANEQINQAVENAGFDNLRDVTSHLDTLSRDARTSALDALRKSEDAESVSRQAIEVANGYGERITEVQRTASDARVTANEARTTAESFSRTITEVSGRIDDLSVNGRNYLRNSSDEWREERTGNWGHTWREKEFVIGEEFQVGDTITYALELRGISDGRMLRGRLMLRRSDGSTLKEVHGNYVSEGITYVTYTIEEDVHHFHLSVTHNAAGQANSETDFEFRRVRVTRSNRVMDWQPAHEDISVRVSDMQQDLDGFRTTVQGVDGRITRAQQTADGARTLAADTERNLSAEINTVAEGVQLTSKRVSTDLVGEFNGNSQLTHNPQGATFDNLLIIAKFMQTDQGGTQGVFGSNAAHFEVIGDQLRVRIDDLDLRDLATIQKNTWYTLAVNVIGGGSLFRILLNNEAIFNSNERIPSNRNVLSNRWFVGSSGGSNLGRQWNGYIDYVAIYDRSIGIDNVRLLGGNPLSIDYGNGLVAYWDMQGLEDRSNHGRNLEGDTGNVRFVSKDTASQAQLSVLNDQINLRVQRNDVVRQINVSNEGILIDGGRTHITGETRIDNGVIRTAHIAEASINSALIANAAILNAHIANLAVDSAQIANSAITNAKIANASITEAKIANLSVSTAKIARGAITTALIQNASITRALIDDLAVNSAKIANGAITSAKIGTAAISTAHIGDGTITNAKIGTLSANKITTGELNAANVRIINADIANQTSARIQVSRIYGGGSEWNLSTGLFRTSGTRVDTEIHEGAIDFYDPQGGRYGGMRIESFDDGARGLVFGSGEIRVTQNRLETLRSGNRHLYVIPSGTGRLMVRNITGTSYYPVQADQYLVGSNTSNRLRVVDSRLRLEAAGQLLLYSNGSEAAFQIGGNIVAHKNLNMNNYAVQNISDERLKTDIRTSNEDALSLFKSLRFAEFTWKSDGKRDFGFIAQEMPDKVLVYDKDLGQYGYDSSLLERLAWKAIQELGHETDDLKRRVIRLETTNDRYFELRTQIRDLEQEVRELKQEIQDIKGAA